MGQREIDRRTYRGDLGGIALFRRCPGTVRVNLGGGCICGARHAGAQTELLEGVVDDAWRDHRGPDDFAVPIRRRNMRHFGHRRDHSLLELELGRRHDLSQQRRALEAEARRCSTALARVASLHVWRTLRKGLRTSGKRREWVE